MTDFSPGTKVHVIGVGGAGMSGLARLLAERGCVVSGSDAVASPLLDELRGAGIDVSVGHDPTHVAQAEVVLWSPAVNEDNVELVAARRAGARLVARGAALEDLADLQRVIGVTGTHGKTSATSMLACVMLAAGRDDSRLLGAPVRGVGANGHWGRGDLLVELDESYGTFALVRPHALGLLNVEPDHLDHYGTVDALEDAFASLVARTSGPVVLWGGDAGARRVARRAGGRAVVVGGDGAWRVESPAFSRRAAHFDLVGGVSRIHLELAVTGAHNVANAAVVAVLAMELGVEATAVREGLRAFAGVPRRFDFRGVWRGADVYEDYAHLPGEIAATLSAARAAGYQRVTAVFQPHRVTRTQRLASSFAHCFTEAARVVVTDIYPAGEANPDRITGALVADALVGQHPQVTYAATREEVLAVLGQEPDPGDALFLLGAGDVAQWARQLPGGVT